MRPVARPTASFGRAGLGNGFVSFRLPVFELTVCLISAYCAAWPMTRGWGGGALAAILVMGLPWLSAGVLWRIWPLVALTVLAGLYALASLFGVFETGWARLFEVKAIPQQLVSYPALLIMVCVFYRATVHSWLLAKDGALVLALAMKLISALVIWGHGGSFIADLLRVEHVTNQYGMPMLLFFYWSMVARPSQKWTLAGAMFSIVCAGSSSAVLVGLFAILFGVLNLRTRTALAITAVLIGFTIFAPLFPMPLRGIDPNAGVRAFFWRDAIELAAQSHLVGVGYGTEVVRNYYPWLSFDWRLVDEGSGQLIYVGLHSSFYQALVRLGLLGLGLLVAGCVVLFRLAREHDQPALAWTVYAVLMASFTVNPSLDSANFIFGNALMIAWLLSAPASLDAQDPAPEP